MTSPRSQRPQKARSEDAQGSKSGTLHAPVSVAIATYNGSGYIIEQLNSIISQSISPGEIIVSDDGSSDSTLKLVRDFARTSPIPMNVLDNTERLGFSGNFLRAASACNLKYVAFCDQDDVWLPSKVETALARLTKDRSLICLHRHILTDAELNPIGVLSQNIGSDLCWEPLTLDPHLMGYGNSMVFDRSLLTIVPFDQRPRQPEKPDQRMAHDHWIYTLAAALGRVSHIHDCLCYYRQHSTNVYGAVKLSRAQRFLGWVTVPLERFEARREVAGELETLFGLAYARNLQDQRLADAQTVYGLRQRVQEARLRVHTEGSVFRRLRSLIRLRRLQRADPAFVHSSLSLAKDFLLGVLALGVTHRR